MEPSPPSQGDRAERRWRLIREVGVFSAKVAVEALRDLVLLPLALVAGLVGLLAGGERPERPFEQVRALGRRFDAWLNLFGEHDGRGPVIDDHFARIEAVLVEQHRRGGVTAQAKQAIDRALDAIEGRPDERWSPSPPGVSGVPTEEGGRVRSGPGGAPS